MMSSLSDGIDNVVVTFDDEDSVFKAGTPMTGKLIVVVDETTPVRGIRMKIWGKMEIHWKKVEGGNTLDFEELEDYLDEELTVWVPNAAKRDEMWLFPGTHEYPFSFDLPDDLPDTLEDSRYATINYATKASVYMTQGRVSHSLEEPFYIITAPDPSVEKPTEEALPKENCAYATICGTCFQKKSFVELYMKIDRNVYQLGEKINVFLEGRVEGGVNDVNKVYALLVQEAIYTVNMNTKDEKRKKEVLVMAEDSNDEDTHPGKTHQYKMTLDIPDRMGLTDFPWCDFIQMEYFIHVVGRTHSFYDDVVVKLPIVINAKDPNAICSLPLEMSTVNSDNDEDNDDEPKSEEKEALDDELEHDFNEGLENKQSAIDDEDKMLEEILEE